MLKEFHKGSRSFRNSREEHNFILSYCSAEALGNCAADCFWRCGMRRTLVVHESCVYMLLVYSAHKQCHRRRTAAASTLWEFNWSRF